MSIPGSVTLALVGLILTGTCNADSSGLPGSGPYGGPYRIGGPDASNDAHLKAAKAKQEEFSGFQGKSWSYSRVVPLDDEDLLTRSVKANAKSRVPDADRVQRYNYVVKDGTIWVAVWNDDDADEICGPNAGLPYPKMRIEEDTMVNFQPEAHKELPFPERVPNPACRAEKRNGVLDAHTKHFMLVQKAGASIAGYEPGWVAATVDYAGELLVFLRGRKRCYVINQGSGTYRPHPGTPADGLGHLKAVARLFAPYVDGPLAVWDSRPDEDITAAVRKPDCWR